MGRAFVAFVVLASGVSGLVITTDRDAWAVPAREGPGGGSAGIAKHAGCKGKRVPVTVRHKTRCKPLTGAFPRPKAMDVRLAYLNDVLKLDLTGRGRRLSRSAVVARKRAARRLQQFLPKALALIDRHKRARGGPSGASDEPAVAAAGCRVLPTFTDHLGPLTMTTLMGANGEEGGTFDLPYAGFTYRVTFQKCRVAGLSAGECPTAEGRDDASGGSHFETTEELRRGNSVVSRRSVTTDDKTTWHAQVGSDARLKYIDIAVRQDVLIVESGGVVLRGAAVRSVRVDMPGGSYDPAGAGVKISGDEVAAKVTEDVFAADGAAAIEAYRAAEKGWTSFDRKPLCAEAVPNPATNTITLQPSQSGQLTIYARARKDGGRATGARWTLSSATNATFSPMSSTAAAPRLTYKVTSAPAGGKVQVMVRFTSTAGVGQATWQQPIKPTGVYLRLVGYTRTEKSTASDGEMTITATLAGGRRGSIASVPACTSATSCLMDVELDADVTSTESGFVIGPPEPQSCPGGRYDFAPTSFPNSLRLGVEFDPNGTSPARLGEGMLPSVGDVINFECGVYDFGDSQVAGGTVPVADLLSGHPVTFAFVGSGTTPSLSLHSSVSINWSLSESVTVQRVQADGTPFTAATADLRSSRP